jgi:hypothetical protein
VTEIFEYRLQRECNQHFVFDNKYPGHDDSEGGTPGIEMKTVAAASAIYP